MSITLLMTSVNAWFYTTQTFQSTFQFTFIDTQIISKLTGILIKNVNKDRYESFCNWLVR